LTSDAGRSSALLILSAGLRWNDLLITPELDHAVFLDAQELAWTARGLLLTMRSSDAQRQ
jgi:hypothetical protein